MGQMFTKFLPNRAKPDISPTSSWVVPLKVSLEK